MSQMNLSEVKARLSEVVKIAASGEDVVILKNGKPCAKVVAVERKRKPIDFAELDRLTSGMTLQTIGAGEFVRAMRDEGY